MKDKSFAKADNNNKLFNCVCLCDGGARVGSAQGVFVFDGEARSGAA